MPTVLVDQYFDSVCGIFSTFDNSKNPFRTTVEGLWNGWAPLYFTIQSMAAGYLANDFPHMAELGRQLQSEAYSSLHQTLRGSTQNKYEEDDDKALLTIIMLGLTTTWHKSDDLGEGHKQAATKLFRKRRLHQCTVGGAPFDRYDVFFEQCLLYWEMLSAIMSDTPLEITEEWQHAVANDEPQNVEAALLFPHPWTGVSPGILTLFAQTSRLIRQIRRTLTDMEASVSFFSFESEEETARKLVQQTSRAIALEEKLLTDTLPSTKTVVDTGDQRTPLDHYFLVHKCYRYASLVLLYSNFPDLLRQRLPSATNAAAEDFFGIAYPYLQAPEQENVHKAWTRSLAMKTLDIIKSLPVSSGTRFLQPILILVVACELHFMPCKDRIDAEDVKVAQARRFVLQRLHELQIELPRNSIRNVQKIIEVTWQGIDAGSNCFWLDVMIENGWETIAG